jgi:serine protease
MTSRLWTAIACLVAALSLVSLPSQAHPGHRFEFVEDGHHHDDEGGHPDQEVDGNTDGDDNDGQVADDPTDQFSLVPAAPSASSAPEPASRLVVYYKSDTAGSGQFSESETMSLANPMTVAEANAVAAELENDPQVAGVLVDRRISRHSISTNDTLSYLMWNLGVGSVGSTNVEPVWPQGAGTGTTVAVLDTGRVIHPDMTGAWSGGYDFISDAALAGDGSGRDADPTDTMSCNDGTGVQSGSPHGLQVASVIAARSNNNAGIAGAAPLTTVQPIRVIASCGGWLSDVLDGMRWAVGLPVAGVPLNPNPVKVLNLSLGTTSPGALCTSTVQSIIDEVRATGATIIVSTGNDSANAITVPAACQGVIAVTANSKFGNQAHYSNVGPGSTISAAGGACQDSGNTVCNGSSYNYITVATHNGTSPDYVISAGTSFAAPHVSAAVALLLERNPNRTPDEITSALVNSARPFSAAGCPSGQCGAGILDIQASLNSAAFAVSAQVAPQSARGGQTVTLTATVDASANSPTFRWRQTSGPSLVLNNANAQVASFTAPQFDGALEFEVTATDTSGLAQIATVSLPISISPQLSPIAALQVDPQTPIRQAVFLVDGSVPQAISVDASATSLGVTVEGNEVVWTAPGTGLFTFQVTPHDATGPGVSADFSISVNGTSTTTAGTGGGGDAGGGALGLHGAILLVLVWLSRRRLELRGQVKATLVPLVIAVLCLSAVLFGYVASHGAATATIDAGLWTASFVHVDTTHLLVNLAGLLLMSVAFAEQVRARAWLFALIVAAPVSHWVVTSVGQYPWAAGLSTAMHAAIAYSAVSMLLSRDAKANCAYRHFAMLICGGLMLKLWLDTIWITSFDGATSAASLHAYAVLVAAVGAAIAPLARSVSALFKPASFLQQSVND